jgi:hypothetical protein
MTLKEQLAELIQLAEELHYENIVYRNLLEHANPPGWENHYRREMTNWGRRQEIGAPFRAAREQVEQRDDPEFLLKVLDSLKQRQK